MILTFSCSYDDLNEGPITISSSTLHPEVDPTLIEVAPAKADSVILVQIVEGVFP